MSTPVNSYFSPIINRLTPKTIVTMMIATISRKRTPPMTPPTMAAVLSAGEGEKQFKI
jgi:hypothetical protein